MRDGGILLRANIRILSTAEGGKTVPIRGSYRPNHNFGAPDSRNMAIGFVDLPEGKEPKPGESIDISILLAKWPGCEEQTYPGRRWRIQEGAKLVGEGTVIAVLARA